MRGRRSMEAVHARQAVHTRGRNVESCSDARHSAEFEVCGVLNGVWDRGLAGWDESRES